MDKDELKLVKQQLSSSGLTIKVRDLVIQYIEAIKGNRPIATDDMYRNNFDDEHYVYVKSIVTRLISMTTNELKQIETLNRAIQYKFEPLPNAFKWTPIEWNEYKEEKIKAIKDMLTYELIYRETHDWFPKQFSEYYLSHSNLDEVASQIFEEIEKSYQKKEDDDYVYFDNEFIDNSLNRSLNSQESTFYDKNMHN